MFLYLYSFLSNRLSSPVLALPVPYPSLPLSFLLALSLSLAADWLVEMDIMRQVHAGREMGAEPWRSAVVNKVKNNQVMVDCSSLRACCSHRRSSQHNHATIYHFLLRNDFFTFSQLLLARSQFSFFFVYLFLCLSWFSTDSQYYLFAHGRFDSINHFLHLSLWPFQV